MKAYKEIKVKRNHRRKISTTSKDEALRKYTTGTEYRTRVIFSDIRRGPGPLKSREFIFAFPISKRNGAPILAQTSLK
jgi:hypothetical protein